MGDALKEAGFTPPWPDKEKPLKVGGAELSKRVAALMSRMADANATLASIEHQRARAQADAKAAEAELEAIGISSIYELTSIHGGDEYYLCNEPNCQRVEIHSWRVTDGAPWRCSEHKGEP